jgi:hypothetical protein
MDILCPVCKFKGSISDNLIPEEGKHVGCPRCKTRMFIRKPVISLAAGKPGGKRPSKTEVVGYDRPVPDGEAGPGVIRARCQSCGGQITVPEDKKLLLCPGCGATIVRQVVDEELEPGFFEYSLQMIGQSFGSVFKGSGKFLKRRAVRRVLVIVVVLSVPYLLFYGLHKSAKSPGGIFNKSFDITFNLPTSEDETSPGDETPPDGGILGFLKSIVRIDITSSDDKDKDEVRIYRIVFNDGGTSDYFRYYRRNGDIFYITLPDGSGGSYELGYEYSDIRSIKRIRKLPADVKVYGVN